MRKRQMIFYRNLKYQQLFEQMILLLNRQQDIQVQTMPDPYWCAGQLIELAQAYGFTGNLWHCFLTLCMMEHENPFSLECENNKDINQGIYQAAEYDFRQLYELFQAEFTILEQSDEGQQLWGIISNYPAGKKSGRMLQSDMTARMLQLKTDLHKAADVNQFQRRMTRFYQTYGVGKLGLNKAFRISDQDDQKLLPIKNVELMRFTDIVGYELQKQKLIANTESFIQGRAANNVLLYGDAGTGKSSSIKAVLNEYYDQGLRMIEIYKHQFKALGSMLEQLKDRNYKFIVYMDDLSFEDHEIEYKYLKAVIEGGLGKKPDNVLIYATSNRRHLIRENFSDKKALDDELHGNDTVQEKLSLAARFGISIYFGSPDKQEFEEIVEALAEHYGIKLSREELLQEANRWELSHGGRSGRTAAQFITHLNGSSQEV